MELQLSLTDAAYLEGWQDARNYDGCLPGIYESDEESARYIEGYGDGMDVNLHYDNGIALPQQVVIANFNRS